jgi:hypothetical protein
MQQNVTTQNPTSETQEVWKSRNQHSQTWVKSRRKSKDSLKPEMVTLICHCKNIWNLHYTHPSIYKSSSFH